MPDLGIRQVQQSADSAAYNVITAGPFKNRYIRKAEILWQGERSAPLQPAGQAAPSFTAPQARPGAEPPPSAQGQSIGDIGADAPPRNPDPGGATSGPSSLANQ